MNKLKGFLRHHRSELLFQLLLFGIVFLFYTYKHVKVHHAYRIHPHDIWFFLNYAVAVCIINYVLLPRFLYRKKYLLFGWWLTVVIAIVMLIEEGVIEKIYFPYTRGAHFLGVFFNLAGILPVITILAGFKFAWDALTRQRELEALQSVVKESELQFLKSQINPHFLFNNLNNLYAHALEQSPQTPEIILELSSVLRYSLYECSEQYVPLQKEIAQLGHYINLSLLQLEDRGELFSTISDMPEGYVIAPLLLTVFVENAFKHSLSSQDKHIRIVLDIRADENGLLHFSCMNSYTEQSNTDHLSSGIGLENVRKRLDLLYPDRYTLHIGQQDDCYDVALTLQLHTI